MKALSFYLYNPKVLANAFLSKYCHWMPDRLFLKIKFRLNLGKWINLKNPKTFSEKLQWLKLFNRRPEYTMMVDKVKAKEYAATILGEKYIIPTLGVWDDPNKIDFDVLPDRFVLKCNHNSGTGMYICKDKNRMNVEKVIAELRKGLKENYYLKNREWPYKDVPRRILAEQYIDPRPDTNDLPDYKFFCFDGKPKYCQVISGRAKKMCVDFFDMDWNHQPFHEPHFYPFADKEPKRPENFETMAKAASRLSKGMPFSRIDFYDTGDHVYFGEITFFPTSGMGGFDPEEYDAIMGQMIILPGEQWEEE